MTGEELKIKISELFPAAVFEETGEWVTAMIAPAEWLDVAKQLRFTPGLEFDFLFCLTCIDWKTHFTIVYHLRSTLYRHTLVVKSKLDRNNPEIETVSDIWR